MAEALRERLQLRGTILDLIERRRTETGDASLGSSIERLLIEEELRELEDVSAIEEKAETVPVRRRGNAVLRLWPF